MKRHWRALEREITSFDLCFNRINDSCRVENRIKGMRRPFKRHFSNLGEPR